MGEGVYPACKGGIISFTKTIGREMACYQIKVNCICPGATHTPLLAEMALGEPGAKTKPVVVLSSP